MLRIYDTNYNFKILIDKCKDACITTTLKTGLKTLSFKLPQTDEYLAIVAEEYYVETDDANYVIKEVNMDKNNFIYIFCKSNIEELEHTLIPVFDVINVNVEQSFNKILEGTNWSLDYKSAIANLVEYKEARVTPYEMIERMKEDFDLEIFYNTKEKKVEVYDYLGEDRGTYFSNELKLKLLSRQGQSYDFATVLYPIGKDGLTIGYVNNGINLLENYSYCNKYLPKYWVQDDIEYAEQLKMAGEAYLSYISSPIVSYGLELSALPPNTAVGDNIILVDKLKRTKQRQRVVKTVRYPFSPERDKVELSNQIVNFANIFTKYNTDFDKQIAYIKKNLATLS